MKNPEKNKAKKAGIRLSVPLLIVLLVFFASVLIIYSTPVLTEEKRTSGDLSFTDSAGSLINGAIEISMTGAPSGGRSNVNSIKWSNAPNAWIYFDAIGTKSISINLRIAEDSPNGRVSLEDYGAAMPGGVGEPAPGMPVKYVELRSTGVSFADADVSIHYTDAELNGLDEKSLVIYSYFGGAWTELPTRVDAVKNVVSATVDTFSVFAISARENGEKINRLMEQIYTPEVKETIESDALKTKGVAVKLTINKRGNGQIKLEDHGKKNPVAVMPPGKSIKFVDISAENISFESAEVRIHYTDEELGNGDESALIIYHWNGGAWDALETSVDAENNILTAVTTSLSPFAVSWGEGGAAQILVATNRFVILDEPRTPFGLGTGFIAPGTGNDYDSATNYWDGAATTINATSMYLRSNGTPVSSKQINFTIYWPNGTQYATRQVTTDSNGLASAGWDLNNKPYYGNWTIKAEADGNFKNTTFIYNWWGCVGWGISGCNKVHTSKDPSEKGTATRNSPYSRGPWDKLTTERSSKSSNKCTICHTLYDGKLISSRNAGLLTENPGDVHRNVVNGCQNSSCHGNYAQHGTNQLVGSCYSASCHKSRTGEVSSKNTLDGSSVSRYSSSTGTYDRFHTPSSTVPCILCHGPMHNITKPDESLRFVKNNDTESSQCTGCHTNYNKHNNTVNCTLCHSDDVHYIQVFAANSTGGAVYVNTTSQARGNCTLCHQNGNNYFISLKSNSTAGSYSGRNPPQVAAPVRHSNDANAGKKWNQTSWYWTYSNQLSWCKYCHGETNHKSVALGRPSTWDGNNVVNSTIGNTTWCAGCHWQLFTNGTGKYQDMVNNFTDDSRNITPSTGYNLSIPPEITGNATYGANKSNPAYFNHTNISIKSDNSCYGCHRNGTSAVSITDFMHNLTDVSTRVSGPDCIGCHDYNKTDADALHRINNTDMKTGVHANLNMNATNSWGVNNDNKKCWGCHSSNGAGPSNYYLTYYDMGDRFANPYQCYDCHGNSTVWAYINVSSAPKVYQHFKNASNVTAASNASDNSSSCVVCHNLPELKVPYTENDTYNTGLSNASHYTTNRTELRNWSSNTTANCSYCHQNSSTAFYVAMIDPVNNRNITNHSTNYNSSNPNCTVSQCHKTGWIHNITLAKPVANSTFCLSCHGDNGIGSINYTNAVTGIKAKHNGTVNCTECHLNSTRDVHPVKYLLWNATFSTGNSSAVNCTTCHQSNSVDSILSLTPDKISSPMYHSDDSNAGKKWNSTPGYWTNGTNASAQLTACYYCHNKTLHNTSALGIPSQFKGNNNVNMTVSSSGTWCASCHYRGYVSGSDSYDKMVSTFKSVSLIVPPEITGNATYAPTGVSGYLDHSSFDLDDLSCKICHYRGSSTITQVMHNVTMGVIGPDCVACHDISGSGAPSNKRINASAINQGVHKNLNNGTTNSTVLTDLIDKACWACHGNGTEPSEPSSHPARYKTPYNCTNCHNTTYNLTYTDSTRIANLTTKKVYEHVQPPGYEHINSTVNSTNADCTGCHNRSKISYTDSGLSLEANVSHYASLTNLVSPTTNCSYCHKNAANASAYWANTIRHAAKSEDDSFCANCHNTTNATTFHSRPLVMPDSVHGGGIEGGHGTTRVGRGFDWEKDDFSETGLSPQNEACVACHGAYGSTGCTPCHPPPSFPVIVPKLCENCHLPNTTSLFTGPTQSALYTLRSDINDTLPRVYAHTNYSNITRVIVPAQSGGDERYKTTCYTTTSSLGEPTGGGTCHAAPYFNRASFGGYYAQRASDTGVVDWGDPAHWTQSIDRMPNTTNCLFCHNQTNVTIRQGWGSAMQVNATNMFGNRYTINNTSCYACHTRNSTQPSDFHSSEVVEGGGPGCLGCHNNSNPQNFSDKYGNPMRYINGANFSLSVHAGMNANNASGYGINASCWACHNSTGYPVANNTHPDNSATPYICTDCHLTGGRKTGAYNATIVYEHFRGGTDIKAGNSSSNISSCINCHENVSEMLLSNNDTDYGTFAGDGIRLNGGNRSYYHYGKDRSDLRTDGGTSANCSYCHQNASTGFLTAMLDPAYNSSINNHSLRYNSSNPNCTQCHSTGWIHNETLTKPSLTLPNSTYCSNCHGSSGGATIRNLTKHNNSVDCSSCHLYTGKDIHPAKYLQPNASFTTSKSTAVNCINCHQIGLAGFLNAPMVPNPMHHGDNASNGTLWNSTGYWTNNFITSCIYCHNDTKHNATALGRPANWKGNNVVGSEISTGNWCAGCHYQGYSSGVKNYSDMSSSFITSGLAVPPGIINGTYAPYNFSRYYNHSLKDYSDATCRLCHGIDLSLSDNITSFVHNITWGSCTGCHYSFEAMNNTTRPDRYVDSGMYNTSLHRSLSCTNCHTQGHRNIGARKACEDCHAVQANPITDKDRHNITPTPSTYSVGGNNVVGITDCTVCHDSDLYNRSISTYGYWKSKDCDYCHTYPDKYYE